MKAVEAWHSERTNTDIRLVRWGVTGAPVLVFPTAGGDAEEIERWHLVGSLGGLLGAGRIKVYSVDSVAGQSWMNHDDPRHSMWLQNQFASAVYNEVVPAIRKDCNDDAIEMLDIVFADSFDPGLEVVRTQLVAGETLPFKSVTSARDGLAEVFYSIGGTLLGEADDAYTLLYTRIAEYLRPDHVDAILLSAQLLERLEQFQLANAAYNAIPPEDPAFHAAELGRADALRRSGDTEAAIEALRNLAKVHANQPGVHVGLGDLLRGEEMHEEANQAYTAAIELIDERAAPHWPIFFARGITYERTDKWAKAEADFRTALELSPDQPQVLNYLGYSFVEMKQNLDEALEMIEGAVAARPDDGYITDSLGWVFYRLGRYSEAVGVMERAAELTPVDPIINDHLGDVYWAVGRYREAEFQWQRALSFEPEDKDAERIRRKLEVGLDVVLEEEGGDPIARSNDG